MSRARFLGSSSGAASIIALGWALGAPWLTGLEPRGPGLPQTPGDLWLLGVFTSGVLALLLGLSALLGGWPGGGVLRDRLQAWRRRADREGFRPGSEQEPPPDGGRRASTDGAGPRAAPELSPPAGPGPGSWIMGVGGWLLALYGLGWVLGVGSG